MYNPDEYRHTDDQELLGYFYADRDNRWLGILLQRYTLLLLGVCMKYLKNEEAAKDSVQQVFLKAITELHKYRVDYFRSWIYQVARNHCLMQLRNKNRFPAELNEQLQAVPDEPDARQRHLQEESAMTRLETALQQLNSEQQVCVHLFYLQKKTYQEIATQTGFTLLQVKSYIQNGKRNLRILMERMQAHEK